MTLAELLARQDLEHAERALSHAVAARDAARTYLETITRRERRRESTRAQLRVVSRPSVATAWTPREPKQRPSRRIDNG
jgi:hypothetical protein